MDFFSEKIDETGAEWRRLPMEKLPDCARCYVEYVEKYGHFIIGRNKNRWFIGIPGRFLQEEKPYSTASRKPMPMMMPYQ